MAKEARIIQCAFYLYSASAIIYCGAIRGNARYNLYKTQTQTETQTQVRTTLRLIVCTKGIE